jgi:hypothetical protein
MKNCSFCIFFIYFIDGVGMKIGFKFFVAYFLLLTVSVWADKWVIGSFDDSPEPGDPDKYIAAESGKGLAPVKPEQVTEQSNVFYVRQKFEDDLGRASYQIFRGRPTAAAKNLGRISLEGISYVTLLKMKLFYKRNADSEDDLEEVYFDGKNIFVQGEDPVYINTNNKWEELRPMVFKEYDIEITSNPPDAAVSIGNISKGLTPLAFTVSSAKAITIVVSKDNYYPTIKLVTPIDGRVAKENLSLVARVPLANPTTLYKAQLETAVKNKDASSIRSIRISVMQALGTYNTTEAKKSIDLALANFPTLAPKAANESAEEFNSRRTIWTNAQNREKDALNREALIYSTEFKELLAEIDVIVEELDFALKYEYIPANALSLSNLGVTNFTLNAAIENSRIKFKYNNAKIAYATVPRNEVAQNIDRVHGVLKIWNIPNEIGNFASIYDIEFFYDEVPLKIVTKGTFVMEEATNASRTTEKDLNGRIAKYAGRTAWVKKDSIATLATLRAGEIPDPLAPRQTFISQTQDDYDDDYEEDDDDDEFEEEMETQKKYDYSRSAATRSATDIFGNRDEYIFWSAVGFAAVFVGTGIIGVLQNSKRLAANDAISVANTKRQDVLDDIRRACDEKGDIIEIVKCVDKWVAIAEGNAKLEGNELIDPNTGMQMDVLALKRINDNIEGNKKVKDSYQRSSVIWFTTAGLSAAISITLFLW